jgi:hypothetical protein
MFPMPAEQGRQIPGVGRLARCVLRLHRVTSTTELRSLSRLRGRAGVGVPPRVRLFVWREPPPAALFERADLPPQAGEVKQARGRPSLFNQRHAFDHRLIELKKN